MNYEGRICRGPMERGAFMLPVAVGCAYNACKFCMLFKDLKYRELPMEQIEAELMRVKSMGGNPERVFFGDGNAFGMKTSRLLEIAELVHKYFPGCHTIKMDATVTNIKQKSDEELQKLSKAGIRELYLGIESGLADVLTFMHKDHTLEEAYAQIDRLHQVGMEYAAHIMTGVAGKGRGLENAERLAEFLNRTNPRNIVNFSMFVHTDAPLYEDIKAGMFEPADEVENLLEERRLLELLDLEETLYEGFHDCITYRVRGALPTDKEKMLKSLDKVTEEYRTKMSRVAYTEECCWKDGWKPILQPEG